MCHIEQHRYLCRTAFPTQGAAHCVFTNKVVRRCRRDITAGKTCGKRPTTSMKTIWKPNLCDKCAKQLRDFRANKSREDEQVRKKRAAEWEKVIDQRRKVAEQNRKIAAKKRKDLERTNKQRRKVQQKTQQKLSGKRGGGCTVM